MRPSRARCPTPARSRAGHRRGVPARPARRYSARWSGSRARRAARGTGEANRRDARSNGARFACLRLRGAVGRGTSRTAEFSRRGGTDTSAGSACASDWNAYEFSRGRGRNTSRRRLSRRDRAGGSGRFGVKSVTSEKRLSASPRSVNRKSRADRKNQTDPPVETRGARLPFILGVAFSFCTRDLLGRATPPRTPRHSNARAHTRRRRKRSRGRPKRLGRLPAHGGLALGAAAYRPFFAVRRIGRRRTHR